MKKKYYIAYGSNLNKRQMNLRCPNATAVGTAELRDYQLLFKGSKSGAYLTIERASGYKVPVGIWEVDSQDEMHLDRYEGYPTFYYKKEMSINMKGIDGQVKKIKAFVYIMHEENELAMPDERYIDICYQGYKDFNFNIYILQTALINTRNGETENENTKKMSYLW